MTTPEGSDPGLEALAAAVRLLGPLAERRLPVYHLDDVALVARALEAAWEGAAPPDLVARLRASARGQGFLSPGVVLEEEAIVLVVCAPEAVCAAFDERAGRLDSHSGFGR
jgi:hypothetical protein